MKPSLFSITTVLFFLTTIIAQKSFSQDNLKDDEGFALVFIEVSGYTPRGIYLDRQGSIGGTTYIDDLKSGLNLKILKLPEGEYAFEKVNADNISWFNLLDKAFKFQVESNQLNYGGHLVSHINAQQRSGSFELLNKSTQSITKLKECCSELLTNYKIEYTGTFPDQFITYYFENLEGYQQ